MPKVSVFRQLMDGAEEAVLATDGSFRVRYANRAAERVLGRRGPEIAGRPLEELLPGSYEGAVPDAGSGWRFEPLDDGWAVYGAPGGAPVVAENWLHRMVQAEQLAAVGQLAAGVAHEIGAPLTAISVAVEYLLKRECGTCPFAARDLEVILTQTRRIAQLSRRLVDLARPGEPVLRPADLNGIVTEALELVERQLRKAGIEVMLLLDPALPGVRADANQLQQVVLNLVLNAQRAMGDAGGRLVVRTRRRGGSVELVVADSGPGIEPEDLPRIFLPFFSRSGGTGLGLPLARQIIHQHGGTIEVDAAPGRGATFTVQLPVETR